MHNDKPAPKPKPYDDLADAISRCCRSIYRETRRHGKKLDDNSKSI